MDRSGFQTSFILGFILCLAKGQETCDGYIHKNDSDFVNGVLGQNISLSCELQSSCVIGLWAFRTSPVKYLNAESCSNCGESFSVSDIIRGDIMYSSLHINNINESLAGIYDCSCQHENGTEKLKCFNLQIENASCQLEITQNKKVMVFDNSSGSQHDEAVRTVNVNIDDNITVRCINDAAKLNTNCKNKSGSLKVKKSKHGCWISCKIKMLCKTRIILREISSTTNSPSTSMTTEEATRRNSSLTSTMSPDDGITAIVSTTYTGKKVTMPASMMFVVILAAFIVILVFIILVLLLKILKGKRKRSAEKEEWINPIYEGFDEGKERDGSTEHEMSIIASQPDQESLDDGVYHYVVTSNSKPIHES